MGPRVPQPDPNPDPNPNPKPDLRTCEGIDQDLAVAVQNVHGGEVSGAHTHDDDGERQARPVGGRVRVRIEVITGVGMG